MPTHYLVGMVVVYILMVCTSSICGAKQDNPLFGQVTPEHINAHKESTVSVVSLWTDRAFSKLGWRLIFQMVSV